LLQLLQPATSVRARPIDNLKTQAFALQKQFNKKLICKLLLNHAPSPDKTLININVSLHWPHNATQMYNRLFSSTCS
jgi:hypothetical protein